MRHNGFSVTADRYIRRARVTKELRELADSFGCKIIRANLGDHSKIGIHLLEAEQFELERALEKAERDGFTAIYLHTFKTWLASKPARKPKFNGLKLIQGGGQ